MLKGEDGNWRRESEINQRKKAPKWWRKGARSIKQKSFSEFYAVWWELFRGGNQSDSMAKAIPERERSSAPKLETLQGLRTSAPECEPFLPSK
jgi:hypothetical protein